MLVWGAANWHLPPSGAQPASRSLDELQEGWLGAGYAHRISVGPRSALPLHACLCAQQQQMSRHKAGSMWPHDGYLSESIYINGWIYVDRHEHGLLICSGMPAQSSDYAWVQACCTCMQQIRSRICTWPKKQYPGHASAYINMYDMLA